MTDKPENSHVESNIVELDVRPYLRNHQEPFQVIMETVRKLSPQDTFVLHATFEPVPLLGVMRTKGYDSQTKQVEKDHWIVTFTPKSGCEGENTHQAAKSAPHAASATATNPIPQKIELDNRGLEPPQPMIRTLAALEKLNPGDVVIIHNDRVPIYLIQELETMGYPYDVVTQPDGSAVVTISKA